MMHVQPGEFIEVRWRGTGTRVSIQKVEIASYAETRARDGTLITTKGGEVMTTDLSYEEFRGQMGEIKNSRKRHAAALAGSFNA